MDIIHYAAIALLVVLTLLVDGAAGSFFVGLYRKIKLRRSTKKYYWAVGFNHRYTDDKKKK